MPSRASLAHELKALIRRGAGGRLEDDAFNALALRAFAHQFETNRPYALYAQAEGRTPTSVGHWTEVPLVPTTAFKVFDLVCGHPAAAEVTFRTSGTTRGERRGTHYVLDLELYHASLLEAFRHWLLPDGARLSMLSLVPDPDLLPDSSLSHMAAVVGRELCAGDVSWVVDPDGGLDVVGLGSALQRSVDTAEPLLVFGTAFALAASLDALHERGERVSLPRGSRVLETGGFKGRRRELSRSELRAALSERLGIPHTHIVAEYGMTEMLSQFYDPVLRSGGALAGVLEGPPWVRTRVLDPDTLRPVPAGVLGVLAHFDLANLHSVSAVLTEDLGVQREGGFELSGRASASELRGCSLTFEEIERAQARHV